MKHARKITVDGKVYQWRPGRFMTVVRDANDRVFLKAYNWKLLGLPYYVEDEDDLLIILPSHVATAIKERLRDLED